MTCPGVWSGWWGGWRGMGDWVAAGAVTQDMGLVVRCRCIAASEKAVLELD